MTVATTTSVRPKGTLKRWAIHRGIESAARIGRLLGSGRRHLARCQVTRDISYGPLAEQRLDVYRPADSKGLLPVLLYVHGGGFSFCSKETHWSFASRYALMGFVVFNIDYRLAPTHKFPAAFDDAARALAWVREQAPKYGGDPSRIVIAGESAGGNLTTSLVAASCYRLSHPSAAALFDSAPPILAALPACGVLQVTDMARFKRRKKSLPDWLAAQLETMERAYLGRVDHGAEALFLADPLRLIEEQKPARPLPPLFVFVGTRDFLLDDSRRLHAAVQAHGGPSELHIYPDEIHAFHALPWRPATRSCWAEKRRFLSELGLVS